MITTVFLTSPLNTTHESRILNVLNENKYYPKVDSYHKKDEYYFKSYYQDVLCRFYKYDVDGCLMCYFLKDFINEPDLVVVLDIVEVDNEHWSQLDEYLKVLFEGGYTPIIPGGKLESVLTKPVESYCVG
jgi:hypothetical protein